MAASLAHEAKTKVLQTAERMTFGSGSKVLADDGPARIEIGRRLFTLRHCGERMIQVKVFTNCDGNHHGTRVCDLHVCACPKCNYAYWDDDPYAGY